VVKINHLTNFKKLELPSWPMASGVHVSGPERELAFQATIKEAVARFSSTDKAETIRVISHLDADGLRAAAIVIKMLLRENRKYCLSIVPQMTEDTAAQLAKEGYRIYIFADLGTGQFDILKHYLAKKEILILDHHEMVPDSSAENIMHVNPHISGIDSAKEVSGAGVAYLFAKELNPKNGDLAHIAIIGAMGDMQEDNGFVGLNKSILADAKSAGTIKVITGLRLFGVQTKPLHKVLEYSSEFPIPGITGSESASIQFLNQLSINPKNGSGWRKLTDLTDEELIKLATGVVLQRIGQQSPEAIIGPVYILKKEAEGSPLRDAKEFATLLNACGRLEKASIGIGACLGDPKCKEEALRQLDEYKQEIASSLAWYEKALKQKTDGNIIHENGLIIINAEDNIMPTIIGTLSSIVAKSNYLTPGTFVLSLARAEDNFTKVSLRIAGEKSVKDEFNLMELLTSIAEKVGGQAGGHQQAAGALIKTEKEKEFIATAKRFFAARKMEEKLAV
jgi:single-stranded-DNA-specific exonuclease